MTKSSRHWSRGIAAAVLLAALPAGAAQAADRAGTWETRLGILYQNSSSWDFEGGTTADVDSDTSLLVGVGYHMTDNLELGGNITFGQTDYEALIVGDEIGDASAFGFRRRAAVSEGLEIGLVAGDHESALAGFRVLHVREHDGEPGEYGVRVGNPLGLAHLFLCTSVRQGADEYEDHEHEAKAEPQFRSDIPFHLLPL